MVKPLSIEDFRAIRHVLEDDDYAISGSDMGPRDLIQPKTWHSIWNLPDSVAIATTDDYGTQLQQIEKLTGAWTCTFEPLGLYGSTRRTQKPLGHAALEAFDAFEASIFNAVVGYYRVAFTALRSVVENMTIGLELELSDNRPRFRSWLVGDDVRPEVKFGTAADWIHHHPPVLELDLTRRIGKDLFRPKDRATSPPKKPGYAREFFSLLSKYAHSKPGFTDGDLRGGSNGPIFVAESFESWADAFAATLAFAALMLRLGRPDLTGLAKNDDYVTLRDLFEAACGQIRRRALLRRALHAVPARMW